MHIGSLCRILLLICECTKTAPYYIDYDRPTAGKWVCHYPSFGQTCQRRNFVHECLFVLSQQHTCPCRIVDRNVAVASRNVRIWTGSAEVWVRDASNVERRRLLHLWYRENALVSPAGETRIWRNVVRWERPQARPPFYQWLSTVVSSASSREEPRCNRYLVEWSRCWGLQIRWKTTSHVLDRRNGLQSHQPLWPREPSFVPQSVFCPSSQSVWSAATFSGYVW